MEAIKVGMREFREKLADYLESGRPLAITRHGETLGFYIPAQKRNRKAELDAMRAAAKDLDQMISSWGASEDELMDEYKEIRRRGREKKSLEPRSPDHRDVHRRRVFLHP
ncbi:MAG TPA: hypothetical protein VKE24_15885 [Candidatus Acidoferrales bacterium]|nr:hypothetical protein [Candidatus Acidoferrales bacterium]